MNKVPGCPLCQHEGASVKLERRDPTFGLRKYFECQNCTLIFLHPGLRLNSTQEKQRYDTHNNNPSDPDYLKFLRQLTEPLVKKIGEKTEGLDYGCGPGPAMDVLFKDQNVSVHHFDPFYFPDERLLKRKYDFITCSETVEHFYYPFAEFLKLQSMLKSGGILAVMTQLYDPNSVFETWWYHRDPTHVCFYQVETFHWIARKYRFAFEHPAKNIIFLSKKEEENAEKN